MEALQPKSTDPELPSASQRQNDIRSGEEASDGIWSSMLKAVGSVNSTPSGTLLLLGGTPISQKQLIQRIQHVSQINHNQDNRRSQNTYSTKLSEIANSFSLGYSYAEFRDQIHGDKISHLDIYTLPSPPNDNFLPLLQDFMQRHMKADNDSIKAPLVGILVDWDESLKSWAKEVAEWIKIIEKALSVVDKTIIEKNTEILRHKFQTYVTPSGDSDSKSQYSSVELPLEAGQYDYPLGIDSVIIPFGSERLTLQDSKTHLSDDTVDFIQQFFRTVALKHGSSLLYSPKSLDIQDTRVVSLISERLKLPVNLKADQGGIEQVMPSVVGVDQIVVPSGWDTQAKIVALKEGFDVELVTRYWNKDVSINTIHDNATVDSTVYEDVAVGTKVHVKRPSHKDSKTKKKSEKHESAIEYYEHEISNLIHQDSDEEDQGSPVLNQKSSYKETRKIKTDYQELLRKYSEVLEDNSKKDNNRPSGHFTPDVGSSLTRRRNGYSSNADVNGSAAESITAAMDSLNYNIGGINVASSEEVFRRLKVQEASNSVQDVPSPSLSDTSTPGASPFSNNLGSNYTVHLSSPTQARQAYRLNNNDNRSTPISGSLKSNSINSNLNYTPLGKPKQLSNSNNVTPQHLVGGSSTRIGLTQAKISPSSLFTGDVGSPPNTMPDQLRQDSQNQKIEQFFKSILKEDNKQ